MQCETTRGRLLLLLLLLALVMLMVTHHTVSRLLLLLLLVTHVTHPSHWPGRNQRPHHQSCTRICCPHPPVATAASHMQGSYTPSVALAVAANTVAANTDTRMEWRHSR